MNNSDIQPLVSILIPVYNVEAYLPACIDSLLNQSYRNLQIVLVDDGSNDESWEICQRFAALDSRIEIYRQENQGVASARNLLLKKIKGDYVIFVDSDDWVELNMIEFLLDKAICHNADVVLCSMVKNDEPVSKEYEEFIQDKETIIRKFLFHSEVRGSLCNKLVKTHLLHGLYFENSISYGEDALFCWHFFQRVDTIVNTTKELYHYRMNEASISHQTFGEKKLTGHKAWRIINEETKMWWPQYLEIAQSRWGVEDMHLLRQASQNHYKKNADIKNLQQTLKAFLPQIKRYSMIGPKDMFYAKVISNCYAFGRLYYKLHLIIRSLR